MGNPLLVSDYVLLTVGDIRAYPAFGLAQDLTIGFFSVDILLQDFLAQLDATGFTYGGGVEENGLLQDLSGFLGILPEGLLISASSTAVELPEPASLALVGLALASLCISRRVRA